MLEVMYYIIKLPPIAGNPHYLERAKKLAEFEGAEELIMSRQSNFISIADLTQLRFLQRWKIKDLYIAVKTYEILSRERGLEKRLAVSTPSRYEDFMAQMRNINPMNINGETIKIVVDQGEIYAQDAVSATATPSPNEGRTDAVSATATPSPNEGRTDAVSATQAPNSGEEKKLEELANFSPEERKKMEAINKFNALFKM